MKYHHLLIAGLALATTLPLAAQNADDLLKQVDKALFLASYTSTIRMETVEPGSTEPKVMVMNNQARRTIGTYIEVDAPARSKGTRFLQLEGSLWLFNPKSGASKAVRLSARDSFQGSTFSNSDVGKSQFSDEYNASRDGEEVLKHSDLGSVATIKIKCVAKTPDAAYGSIEMWLRASDFMPLKMEYYAKSGLLFKRMEMSAIKNFGSITRPSVMRMESLEKSGTISTIHIEAMVEKNLPDTIFNKNYLTR